MRREELELVLAHNQYLKGGTKEAGVKVRDFLRHATNQGNEILSARSCVTTDEFMEAVKTLMAFAFQQEDTIPNRWKCDNDCLMITNISCPGEYNISDTANKICPFFSDEGLI